MDTYFCCICISIWMVFSMRLHLMQTWHPRCIGIIGVRVVYQLTLILLVLVPAAISTYPIRYPPTPFLTEPLLGDRDFS